MKEVINKKFENISHKWLTVPLDSLEFENIKQAVIEEVKKSGDFKKHQAKKLADAFKEKGFAWIKFIKVTGRKNNINTVCQIIDEQNYKIDLNLPCQSILDLGLLDGTPKSLKLYKSGEKVNSNAKWKKPSDGFTDNNEIPLEEEFTEAGYILYKDFHLELKSKNITLDQWHAKRGGPNWQTVNYFNK
jgi:hypothetical protein